MKNIKLFTISYPFNDGETFLKPEIDVVSNRKDINLTIIPFFKGEKCRDLQENVVLDTSLADRIQSNSENKVYPLFNKIFKIFSAIFQHRAFSFSAIRDVVGFVHHGNIVRKWANENVQNSDLLYTYWFERVTYGLSLYLKKNENILVTRAHGFDLYEERRKHQFIPFRIETFKQLSKVYTVSIDGEKYLKDKYELQDKTKRSTLGIKDEGCYLEKRDSLIRIVSCSTLIPLKRVDMIAQVIIAYCRENPHQQVFWDHFGGGNELSKIQEILKDSPINMEFRLHGQVLNSDLISFYKTNYVDVFVNLSTTEGLPVSMMEAASFYVPILATNVGGVSELVDTKNGILLEESFSLVEAVLGISKILKDESLRDGARTKFESFFIASKNYTHFYDQLIS